MCPCGPGWGEATWASVAQGMQVRRGAGAHEALPPGRVQATPLLPFTSGAGWAPARQRGSLGLAWRESGPDTETQCPTPNTMPWSTRPSGWASLGTEESISVLMGLHDPQAQDPHFTAAEPRQEFRGWGSLGWAGSSQMKAWCARKCKFG